MKFNGFYNKFKTSLNFVPSAILHILVLDDCSVRNILDEIGGVIL